jgi:hypothetical protein
MSDKIITSLTGDKFYFTISLFYLSPKQSHTGTTMKFMKGGVSSN